MTKAKRPAGGMTQGELEQAVCAAIEKRLGSPVEIFDSVHHGVVAFERLGDWEADRIDWQEVAAELARETGIGVTCVVDCDWSFDDRCDEEATFVSFALPSVPEDYRDDEFRNQIRAVDPRTAPSQQDFDDLKRARLIVERHLAELAARRDKLTAAKKPIDEVVDRIASVERLKRIEAGDRAPVAALLALDFDGAMAALPEPEAEAPSPGM